MLLYMMERQVLLNNLIIDIDRRKTLYQKEMYKYKMVDDVSEAVIVATGVCSTSCLIIGLTTVNPLILIIGTVSGFISTLISAIKKVFNIQQKFESCKITYLHLNDLSREAKVILARNHLTTDDRQALLLDLSNKLSIIDDTAPCINYRSSSSANLSH